MKEFLDGAWAAMKSVLGLWVMVGLMVMCSFGVAALLGYFAEVAVYSYLYPYK